MQILKQHTEPVLVPDALFYGNSLVSADVALSSAIKNSLYEICDARDCMFVCANLLQQHRSSFSLIYCSMQIALSTRCQPAALFYSAPESMFIILLEDTILLCMRGARKMVTRCEKCALKAEKWPLHLLAIFCFTLAK